MGNFLLSIFSAEILSWTGFVVLGMALVGEAGVAIIPTKWEKLHKELAFGFAVLAAAGYAVERVGDEAIIDALKGRAATAEASLKKLTSDRELTDEQIAVIANKLRWFAGQEYRVTTFWDMREPLAITNRIHAALQLANWKYLPHETATMMLGGIESVQVWIHPEADPRAKEAAKGLIDALNGEHIAAVAKEQNPKNPKMNEINLNVGTRP